jgi:hypothetical protein
MTVLQDYWPIRDEVNRCMTAEAEVDSDAVLLAVHQPMDLVIREAHGAERPAEERNLLDALLTEDIPEGTVLVAITGASGAGKSHVIRWLAAQLKRDPRAERMHVIRIPKTASLRSVVESILEPLQGDPAYRQCFADLQRAVTKVTPDQGGVLLAAGLELALREDARQNRALLMADPQRQDARALRARIDHAQRLPGFFNDAALGEHFKFAVFSRVVQRAISGQSGDDQGHLPQFEASDLEVPEHVDLSTAANQVQTYYQTILNRTDGTGRQQAAEILNGVLDEAIGNVFRLNEALGGITLEDVILHIRELLLVDDRQLVLLIEDFAALSGIQEVLLSVCIQESVYQGEQVRSPMRTALAVTDGYLAGRETILTRAKREWVVRSNLGSDEQVISRCVDLVGRYLNAARFGAGNLAAQFEETSERSVAELTDWVEIYQANLRQPEDEDILEAFGQSESGVPLFPFNVPAIHSFANGCLRTGDSLLHNPRRVINFVLRDLLLRRDEFCNGRFPVYPEGRVRAEVAGWLSERDLDGTTRQRLESVLVHWGGNPATMTEVSRMPAGIFRAFALPTPVELGLEQAPPAVVTRTHVASIPERVVPPEPKTLLPELRVWESRFEAWAMGTPLQHNEANVLRQEVAKHLASAVDWNALCISPQAVTAAMIEIPTARGNKDTPPRIELAKDSSDPDGTLRRALLALVRYREFGPAAYEGIHDDTARIANLVDHLLPQYINAIERSVAEEVSFLTDTLLQQGRVLGVTPKRVASPSRVAALVLSSVHDRLEASPDASEAVRQWCDLLRQTVDFRVQLQEYLRARLGCFQGKGGEAYAIDVVRLRSMDTDAEGSPETPKSMLQDQRWAKQQELHEHIKQLGSRRLTARSRDLVAELTAIASDATAMLGEQFVESEVTVVLHKLMEASESAMAWPTANAPTRSQLRALVDAFDGPLVRDLLRDVKPLRTAGSRPEFTVVLECLSAVDFGVARDLSTFTKHVESFVVGLERSLRETGSNADPETEAIELMNALNQMQQEMSKLSTRETTV